MGIGVWLLGGHGGDSGGEVGSYVWIGILDTLVHLLVAVLPEVGLAAVSILTAHFL